MADTHPNSSTDSTTQEADTAFQSGNFSLATTLYQAAITSTLSTHASAPETPTFQHLCASLLQLGNWSEVERVLKDLLPKYEGCAQGEDGVGQEMGLRILLARALGRMGKVEEARAEARRALSRAEGLEGKVGESWVRNVRGTAGELLD